MSPLFKGSPLVATTWIGILGIDISSVFTFVITWKLSLLLKSSVSSEDRGSKSNQLTAIKSTRRKYGLRWSTVLISRLAHPAFYRIQRSAARSVDDQVLSDRLDTMPYAEKFRLCVYSIALYHGECL